MKQKSITFRCSQAQFARLEAAMETTMIETRTSALSQALEEFLDFVEQPEAIAMDLFALVDYVDREGCGPKFSEQA